MKILYSVAFIFRKKYNDGRVVECVDMFQDIVECNNEKYIDYYKDSLKLNLYKKAIYKYKKIKILKENYKIIK